MNQKLKNQIISYFAEDWGESSPQFEACTKIFDYLLSYPVDQLTHLTYSVLKKTIGDNYSTAELLKATQYLCGDKVSLLSLYFEISDEDDYYVDINYDDIRYARKTGKLIHPRTGEIIEDYEAKVFIYFKPSSLINEVQNS